MTAPNPGSLGVAQGSVVINYSSFAGMAQAARSSSQQVQQAMSAIGQASNAAGAALQKFGSLAIGGFAVRQIAQAAVDFTELGVEVRRAGTAFATLAGGQNRALAMLRSIQKASGGTIDLLEGMRIANQAVALGLADSSQGFERLIRAARGVTFVSPVIHDISAAVSELSLASANLSFQRLDQLGLDPAEFRARMAEIQKENSGLGDSTAFLQTAVELLNDKYGDLADNATSGLERLGAATRRRVQSLAQEQGVLDRVAGALADQVDRTNTLDEAIRIASSSYDDLSEAQIKVVEELRPLVNLMATGIVPPGTVDQIKALSDEFFRLAEAQAAAKATAFAGTGVPVQLPSARSGIPSPNQTSVQIQQAHAGFEEWRRQARADADAQRKQAGDEARRQAKELADLTRDNADRISDIARQAGQQRVDEARSYEERRTEVIRQYEESIAREAQDFARNRARAQETLNRQIARAQEDLEERLRDLRADSAERITELQEDAARERERRARDHENNLLDAAARLDAVALVEEQRRFAQEEQERKEDLEERVRDEEKNLQDRITEEKEAHEESLQEMRDAFEIQRQIEADDRRIRLERQAADHQAQLDQLDAAHVLRLAQIDRHAAEERARWDAAFARRMENIPGFAAGGPVLRTGLALLHQGEYVIPAARAEAYGSSGSRASSIVVESGAISLSILGSTDMSRAELKQVAREALVEALEEVSQ